MFQTMEKNGLVYLTSGLLSGVCHGFTTRLGGVSPAPWDSLNLGVSRGDAIENVQQNYRLLGAALGLCVENAVLSQQTHTDNVRIVTAEDRGKGLWRRRDYTDVDAMVTDVPHTPLVVFGADCNVILLHDPVHHAIGACHAGWRGTAAGIVAKTVAVMAETYGTRPGDVYAAMGPSIGRCCFETDGDVSQALRETLGGDVEPLMDWNGTKWHVDLKAANALWLRRAGVQHIDVCDQCTMCRPERYWSHRRCGNRRGVQAAVISLEDTL